MYENKTMVATTTAPSTTIPSTTTPSTTTGEKEKNVSNPKICIACGKVIKDQFVRALGEIYHLDCFRCMDCDEICVSKFFPIKEDGVTRPLCETDYFRRKDLICAKCGLALRGPHINALNKKYHLDHFTCTVCNVVFQPNASYYEYNGNIYCQNHYSKLFAQKCGGCHTPVLRQLIEVNKNNETQEQWHPECYMIYKSWNVRLVLGNDTQNKPIEPKDYNDEIEKQKLVEEKIAKIWKILSAFEESSAECIAEILSFVSHNLYLNGIEQAGNFVCHVEVLFSGIDEIETQLKKFNDKTGLQHTKEPKLLAKRIVNFFSLLTHRNNNSRQDSTKEFLSLVTVLAHTLKILIRSALCGALKLENSYNVKTALDSFLGKFLTLGNMQTELRQQQLMSSREYSIQSEYCPVCHRSVEEECIKLSDSRWHSGCFNCQKCKKNLYNSLEEARMEPTSKTILCKDCSPSNVVAGFIRVTQLEQYSFLLKFALKRLYIINMKTENVENNGTNDNNDDIVSPSLRQQSNNLGKPNQKPINPSGPKQAKLENSIPYYSGESLQEDNFETGNVKDRSEPQRISQRGNSNDSIYNRQNQNTDQYYSQSPQFSQNQNMQYYGNNPIRKSYSYDQSTEAVMNNQQKYNRSNEILTKSPEGLKAQSTQQIPMTQQQLQQMQQQQSITAKANYNLHRSYSHGTNKYSTNTPSSPPFINNNQNPAKSPRLPNIRSSHSPSRSPSNGNITANIGNSQLNHSVMSMNNNSNDNLLNMNGSKKSISLSNNSINKNSNEGVRYYSELQPYEVFSLRLIARDNLKELLPSSLSIDYSSLIEDRKLKLWEKVVISFQKKNKDGTFGVPLDILVDRHGNYCDLGIGQGQGTVRIPNFIEKIIKSLKSKDLKIEGIFRKNGNIRRLKMLTEKLDQYPENIDFDEDNSIQLAALLKKFLRDLPEPLLTFKLHKVFISSQEQESEEKQLKVIQNACYLLPKCNRDLLEVLLLFLIDVSAFSNNNKMDVDNLATIMAPTICYSKSKDPIKDESLKAINVLKMMMLNQEKLWTVNDQFVQKDMLPNQIKDVKRKNEGMIKAHSSNDFRVAKIEDNYNYALENADSGVIHPGSAEKIDMFQ